MEEQVYVEKQLDQFMSITSYLEAKGFHYSYVILRQEVVEANKIISSVLGIPLASEVFSYRKLRIVEGIPRTIEQIYIDYKRVPGIEKLNLENQSLYRVLKENYGYDVTKLEEEIRIVRASKEEMDLLKIDKPDVVMATGKSYTTSLLPLEYFQEISIPSFLKYRSVEII